jgi:hypothetical protein
MRPLLSLASTYIGGPNMLSKGAPTRTWEYRAIYLDWRSSVEADLDGLGDEGWELVSVAESYAYVKRATNIRPSQHRARAAG